jgi:hypothetical protein
LPLLPIIVIDTTAVRLTEWGNAYYNAALHPPPQLTTRPTFPGAPSLPPAKQKDENNDHKIVRRRSHPTPWGSNPPPPKAGPAELNHLLLYLFFYH